MVDYRFLVANVVQRAGDGSRNVHFPQPGETKLTGKNACYEVYKTKNGGYLSIGPIEPRLWANLCEYFDKKEFVQWQIIDDKQEIMIAFLREKFLSRDRDEWIEILQKIDVCIAPVLTIAEVFRDPQVLHRKMVFEMEHSRFGKIKQLGFSIKLSDTPAQAELAPPDLGEHTDEILDKLGYSAEKCKFFKLKQTARYCLKSSLSGSCKSIW